MHFTDFSLHKQILKALANNGYTTPTTIQEKVFSVVMSGADVCGIAQTGTGKTLAYLLPLLNLWKYAREKNPQVLVLVPTRELVAQVVETAEKMSAYLNVVVKGVYGGTNINTQKLELENGCDVLVATPGRVFDLAMAGAFKVKDIKKLVIDEMDEMLNLGFRTQIKNIIDLLPPKRQNLLFSATLIEEVEVFIEEYFDSPQKLEAAPAGTPVNNIEQSMYEVPNFYTKANLLSLLLNEDVSMAKVLVFVSSKKLADQLYGQLPPALQEVAGVIHSNKEQNHRFNTVKQFKEGIYRFIIATDIVARGIDVAAVTHVINFDIPEVPENYIHRIGRTGRADMPGKAISFITDKDHSTWQTIQAFMNRKVPVTGLPAHLIINPELTEDEKPRVYIKEIQIKVPKRDDRGPSFHPKSIKNSKVYNKVSHRDKMKKKYGKPATVRGKKKK